MLWIVRAEIEGKHTLCQTKDSDYGNRRRWGVLTSGMRQLLPPARQGYHSCLNTDICKRGAFPEMPLFMGLFSAFSSVLFRLFHDLGAVQELPNRPKHRSLGIPLKWSEESFWGFGGTWSSI